MKELVTLVSLFPQKTVSIAKSVCKKLNKFMLIASDLVDYEISDKTEMEKNCGKEYLDKCINRVLISITEYESAIVAIDYSLLFRNIVLDKFKERTNIVYIKLNKDNLPNLTNDEASFDEREIRLMNNSKLIIDVSNCTKENDIIEMVIRQLTPLLSNEF